MYVHSVVEASRDTLYLATVGRGIFKVTLYSSDEPVVKSCVKLGKGAGYPSKELYFSAHKYGDDVIWFANRGIGAVSYNIKSGMLDTLSFSSLANQGYNDVYAVSSDDSGELWFGTGSGVVRKSGTGIVPLDLNTGAVHSIINDGHGSMWISTNKGLFRYGMANGTVEHFGYSHGLGTISFSDGAGYVSPSPYYPQIAFQDVHLGDRRFSVHALMRDGVLTVASDQTVSNLSFTTLDYLDNINYTYYYRIKGYSNLWKECGKEITFANISYGKYDVEVKYRNDSSGYESPTFSMPIRIKAPFYASVMARVIYSLLILTVLSYVAYSIIKRRKSLKLTRQRQYETALKECQKNSLTNILSDISTDLSTPLTVISGMTQTLLDVDDDENVRHCAGAIRQSVTKLLNLSGVLQHLCGRKMENAANIELVDVSKQAEALLMSFKENMALKEAEYSVNISPAVVWPMAVTDFSILLNLVMNVILPYVNHDSKVCVGLSKSDSNLLLTVQCEGLSVPFNLILEYLGKDSSLEDYNERPMDGALALEACRSIAGKMGCQIEYDLDESRLMLLFPYVSMDAGTADKKENSHVKMDIVPETSYVWNNSTGETRCDPDRDNLFILNDCDEIMSFVSDALMNDFNVISFTGTTEIIFRLRKEYPSLILCELNGSKDVFEMIESIKSAKETVHIPIVSFVQPNRIQEIPGNVRTMIDLLVTIPFDIHYLKTSVTQLARRNTVLKDYYHSSLSSFELQNGQYIHDDNMAFVNKIRLLIDNNLSNSDLSTEFLAREMCVSVRNLYRRLDGVGTTPSNMIKEYRLSAAANLLATTKLTIDEVIFRTGFQNRGTFFRLFAAKYGQTPKAYRNSMIVKDFGKTSAQD